MRYFWVAALLSGCSADSLIQVVPTWPNDQVAFLVITDASGAAIGPSPLRVEDDFARLTLDTDDLIRVHVVTYLAREDGGPDFATCGVAIRGAGVPLTSQASYFVSELIDSTKNSGAIALAESALENANALGLTHSSNSCVPTYPCEQVVVTSYDSPVLFHHGYSVAAIDDSRAVVAIRAGEGVASRLLQLEGASVSLLLEEPSFGPLYSVAFDGTRLWGTSDDGVLFSANLQGTITSSVARPGIGRPRSVVADRSGSVLLHGDAGLEVISGVFDQAKRDAVEVLGPDVKLVALTSPDRIFAESNNSFHFFDGGSWSTERENAPDAFEEFFALAVDREFAVAGGKFERLIVRTESSRAWRTIPPIDPSGAGILIRGVAALGGDRYLGVGEVGLAAVYANEQWCKIDTGTTNAFEALAISPSRRTAYAVGRFSAASGNKPALLRFDLPE